MVKCSMLSEIVVKPKDRYKTTTVAYYTTDGLQKGTFERFQQDYDLQQLNRIQNLAST